MCRAAQEAGVPPVSILTGRRKTQFSHLCSSVIPYPIGTKCAREVPASKGSLHTKFEENRSSHFRDTSEQNFVLISSFFSVTIIPRNGTERNGIFRGIILRNGTPKVPRYISSKSLSNTMLCYFCDKQNEPAVSCSR